MDLSCFHRYNHSFPIHKNLVVSLHISKYPEPNTFGELLRKYRLENDLYAKELGKIIGVDECTILNWEKDRSIPCQKLVFVIKEKLSIDPFQIVKLGGVSERQKAIFDLITERGQITRAECQKILGIKKTQTAQNNLFFLYKLGVLDRTLGARKRATYFVSEK